MVITIAITETTIIILMKTLLMKIIAINPTMPGNSRGHSITPW